jgi:hypothetical protein
MIYQVYFLHAKQASSPLNHQSPPQSIAHNLHRDWNWPLGQGYLRPKTSHARTTGSAHSSWSWKRGDSAKMTKSRFWRDAVLDGASLGPLPSWKGLGRSHWGCHMLNNPPLVLSCTCLPLWWVEVPRIIAGVLLPRASLVVGISKCLVQASVPARF